MPQDQALIDKLIWARAQLAQKKEEQEARRRQLEQARARKEKQRNTEKQ